MISASENYVNAINSTSRQFSTRILCDGSTLECDIVSIRMNKGAIGENIEPGAVFVPYTEITVKNCDTDVENKEIRLFVGVKVAGGSTEEVSVGRFIATKPKVTTGEMTFTAIGKMGVNGGAVYTSALTYPASVTSVINEISAQIGMTISLKGLVASGTIEKSMSGQLLRDAVGYVAGILGGFATEDNAGNIVIAKYGSGDTAEIEPWRSQSEPEFAENAYECTGIQVIVTEDIVNEDGSVTPGFKPYHGDPNIRVSNPYMTQALFNSMYPRIEGYAFDPGEINMSMGHPLLEPWDSIQITDLNGNEKTVPCLRITHYYDGGFRTDVDGVVETEVEQSSTVSGHISKAIERFDTDLLTVRTAVANRAKIADLEATEARIDDLEVDTAKIHNLTAGQISATVGYVGALETANVSAQNIVADHSTVGSLNVNYAHLTNGVIDNANIGYLNVNGLSANYADIHGANIDILTAQSEWVDKIMVQTGLIASQGTVYYLDAIKVNASDITAGTLDVERLIVTVQGEKYLVHIDPVTSQPTYQKLDGDVIEDLTITADKIVAGAITADKITTQNIVGTGGWINLRNGTFMYYNAQTADGISWDGSHLTVSGTITVGNTTLAQRLDELDEALVYDHTFTISNGVATFAPHVYQKGAEVTTDYATSCFTWKYRLIDGSEVTLTTKNDRGCDVIIANLGYGGHVIGIFTPA